MSPCDARGYQLQRLLATIQPTPCRLSRPQYSASLLLFDIRCRCRLLLSTLSDDVYARMIPLYMHTGYHTYDHDNFRVISLSFLYIDTSSAASHAHARGRLWIQDLAQRTRNTTGTGVAMWRGGVVELGWLVCFRIPIFLFPSSFFLLTFLVTFRSF